jgi:uncharacterized membrane protein
MSIVTARHGPFLAACLAGVAAFALSLAFVPALAWTVAANAAFLVYLLLTLLALPGMSADWLSRNAADDDVPVAVIFLVALAAVAVSVVLLFGAINSVPSPGPAGFALAFSAVPLGWLTIHLMAAIHYAHEYWQPSDSGGTDAAGGLAFPGTDRPGGIDFVYFAFVIGMTAQTSDVDVTASPMRRAAVLHGIVSFFFNTVIVAAAVNIVVSMGR